MYRDIYQAQAVSDVDDTAYNPTKRIIGAGLTGDLTPSWALLEGVGSWLLKKAGIISRDQFAKSAGQLYSNILQENGPTRMEEFYWKVAKDKEQYHEGSIELYRTLINNDILLHLVTGNDEEFVKILLEANDIDPQHPCIKIHGSQFEQKHGQYTGRILRSNINSGGKRNVIQALDPHVPLILAAGDDDADGPMMESVIDGGLCIMVGFNKFLARDLRGKGFSHHTRIDTYCNASGRRVLQVCPKAKKGGVTLADVVINLSTLVNVNGCTFSSLAPSAL